LPKWFHVCAIAAGLSAAPLASAQTTAQIGVGILDSGTNAGGINLQGGQSFVGNPDDLSDGSSNAHGTTSTLLVSQQAPGVPIYMYKVVSNETPSQGATEAGIIAAAAEPAVNVIALTNTFTGASSVISQATALNKFVTIWTGNTGGGQPNGIAVLGSQNFGAVAVAGSDGSGVALANSAVCGIIAARCLHAVGATPLVNYFGSSFASANLAGIAAAVWQASPWLTNEELAQVLFATAKDLGAPGVDAVYGQGFIADAAQVINNPAGPTSIPSGSGGGGGGGAAIALGVAAAGLGVAVATGVVGKNKDKLEKTLVLDPFGRPFVVDLTKMAYVRDTSKISVSDYLHNLDELYNSVNLQIGNKNTINVSYSTFSDDRFDVGRHFSMEGDPAYADRDLDWSARFRSTALGGMHYSMGLNVDPALDFGAMGSVSSYGKRAQPVTFISGQNFSTPYLGFATRADSAALGYSSRKGWGLQFAVVNTDTGIDYGPKSVAGILEGSYQFGSRGKLTAQFGQLKETGSLFGGSKSGIFGVDETTTYALSVSGAWRITEKISAIGNYGIGYSLVDAADASLLHGFSSIRSNWFGLGVIGHHLFRDHDQWGAAFSQPLRVIDGAADMYVPYARDVAGNIYGNVDRIGLNPTGREYTFETFYRLYFSQRGSVGAHFMYQHEPEHNKAASDAMTVLATLRYGF